MRPILAVFLCVVLAACAASSKKTGLISNHRIALFPLANDSNDLEAPSLVRVALFKEMGKKGHLLIPMEEIDAQLKEMGVTDGGQLGAIDVERLREKIPADRFCYGTLVEFTFKSAVALSQRKVEIRLKLVDAHNGAVLYERQESGVTTRGGTDAAGDLVLNVAGKVVKSVKDGAKKLMPAQTGKKAMDATDALADVELTAETDEAIRKLLEKFPK
ncbi:MAG: DUF799 family lipoprotein [Elusimicrobia bacterium]|nr:DUF799 family lipoprotein [Elusimicrobiota bacterium]